MSLPLTVEGKSQAKNEAMAQHKCRIPQRLPPGRQRTPLKLRSNVDNKNKPDVVSLHQRCNIKNITYRPRSNESDPKSVNKSNDDNIETIPKTRVLSRSCRQERLLPAVKVVIDFGMFHIGSDRLRYHVQDIVCQKPFPSVYKKVTNEKMIDTPNKMGRQIITVPLKQKMVLSKATCQRSKLPDQETIKKQEDLELQQEDSSDAGQLYNDMKNLFLDSNEEDSITSRSDRVAILKNNWHERIIQFQEMKDDLYARQKSILEVYASLRYTKDSLHALGQPVGLPPADGLRIMNVDHMTPAQLLQLCAGTPHSTDEIDTVSTKALKVDINKLSEMPMKLVAICEQTLVRRKEFIDWFQSFLNNSEKEYSKQKLIKKVNEFKEENKMVDSNLQYSKNKFIKDTTDHLRMYWNETIRLQLQNEELTFHLSELDSENKDLKKKISNCEQQRSYSNKLRIEELEKDLKEENIKKITIKDRLSRAEGQIKIGEERSAQLEGTLNQSQKQTRTLERTIQQLQDKNQLLQKNFDEELNKLKESMLRNTSHLEEIATAREALQSEKEDLKKKLEELSNEYNESINNLKQELNKNVSVLVEVEKKYNDAVDEKIMLQKTIESQCAHYEESESRYKETLQQLQEMEATLNKTLIFKEQLETITHDLNKNNFDLAKYKNRVLEQNKIIKEIEYKYNKSQEYGENLKGELNKKAEHVTALEKSKNVLEKQLQESEYKMQTYENQLCTLREEITNLQEHFGEFQNLNDLHELVNQESGNLVVVKQEFDKITEDINRKRNESDRLDETLAEQEDLIKQRNHILELLSEKEEEKTEIINFSQEIEEKNTEINSLVTNIETRKKQISQLEKIILTLEDQNRKATVQKRKDHEIICALEKKVAEYANYIEDKLNRGANSENLDNLIKILEDEMEAPFASQHESYSNYRGTQTLDYHHNSVHHKRFNNGHHSIYQQNNENTPTKIVLGNFVKKTYNIPNDTKYKSDLDRKQAITNIDAQKWIAPANTEPLMNTLDDNNLFYINAEDQVTRPTERYLKNLQYFVPSQSRIEKKSKMFKLAGHRLN